MYYFKKTFLSCILLITLINTGVAVNGSDFDSESFLYNAALAQKRESVWTKNISSKEQLKLISSRYLEELRANLGDVPHTLEFDEKHWIDSLFKGYSVIVDGKSIHIPLVTKTTLDFRKSLELLVGSYSLKEFESFIQSTNTPPKPKKPQEVKFDAI